MLTKTKTLNVEMLDLEIIEDAIRTAMDNTGSDDLYHDYAEVLKLIVAAKGE